MRGSMGIGKVIKAEFSPEGLANFFLWICVFHFSCHHGQEFGKIDGAVAVGVDLVDHVLELRLGRILPQRPHPEFDKNYTFSTLFSSWNSNFFLKFLKDF